MRTALFSAVIALGFSTTLAAQSGAGTEWRYWGGDAGSTRYSPLDQITAGNAGQLEVAWRWRAANFGPEPETYYRATPLYADGMLYTVAGERRAVAAIDPASGETIWTWRMDEGLRWEKAPRRFSGRGLAYWSDGRQARIIVVTPGYHMVALDARTGRQVNGFGTGGVIDLMEGMGYPMVAWSGAPGPMATNGDNGPTRATAASNGGGSSVRGIDPAYGTVGSSSPPIVVGNVIVVGNSAMQGYYPRLLRQVAGHIRGYDVRNGRLLWTFRLIPRAGQFGADSWEGDALETAGKVDAWAPYSADEELGLVYIPVGHAHNDYFGGHRPGANLFSQSLVALDARTGQRRWHFQMVHHDIWNFDTPTAPTLLNATVNGRPVRMVIQTTKQSWAYTFDRATGEPVWPIEERAVAQSDVPGERTAATQPFPTRPAPYDRQGVSENDLIDFTPALRQEAVEMTRRARYRFGPIFTPPTLWNAADSTGGTLVAPGANGGTNIMGGTAVDPETGMLYVASQSGFSRIAVESNAARSEMPYVSMGPGGVPGPRGLPLLKPPYGRITAINMNTGDHVWMIPNGSTPDNIRNNPALRGVEIPNTGRSGHANLLATKTLLFYGEGRGGGTRFHALDKATGREIAAITLPAPTNAAPITFLHQGRQYIVVAIASADVPAELVAIALPAERRGGNNEN